MRSCRQTNANPAAVKNAVDVTLNSFGGLDILVNKSQIHIGEIHQVQHLAADAKYLADLGNAVLHPAGSRSLERTLIQIGLDSRDRCLSSLAARHCSSLLCFGHLDRRVCRCDLRLSRTDCGFTAACGGAVIVQALLFEYLLFCQCFGATKTLLSRRRFGLTRRHDSFCGGLVAPDLRFS